MHAAPPVNVRAGGGAVWRSVGAVLHAAAAAAVAAWLAAGSGGTTGLAAGPQAAAAAVAGLIALAVAWRLGRPQPLDLAWDGERWTADGLAGQLDVMVDLDSWMLLRLRPDADGAAGRRRRARWVPVAAAEAGPAWHALRVAAHTGRARSGGLPPGLAG